MKVYKITVKGKGPSGSEYKDEYEAEAEDKASAEEEARRLLGLDERLVSVKYLREA